MRLKWHELRMGDIDAGQRWDALWRLGLSGTKR
ncbi:hypothetical protein CLV88_101657 [Shimia abyssi]|uniref:Uncharacterized protein n=1 Tax=Shimia abyssi TaxID=1662395 RepID=A0A2P8FKJ0_9RHOB|nr:hypothetical protein CLV88_101657 [Shimia abyssi]